MAIITETAVSTFIPEIWLDDAQEMGCERDCMISSQYDIRSLADILTHTAPDGRRYSIMIEAIVQVQANARMRHEYVRRLCHTAHHRHEDGLDGMTYRAYAARENQRIHVDRLRDPSYMPVFDLHTGQIVRMDRLTAHDFATVTRLVAENNPIFGDPVTS